MENLEVTTLELWPIEARKRIHAKGLSIKNLRKKYNHIIFPDDDCYDRQRQLFSTQIQERPLFIIRPISKDEIKDILNMIYKYSLTMRIIGGRHSTALQNPDIFLDMSEFNHIKFDKNSHEHKEHKEHRHHRYNLCQHLKVGAGATQGAVNAYLFSMSENYYFSGIKPNHPTSLAFPSGSAASVGIAGISTIGGIGTLRRSLGLAVDSIKSFTIVLPPNKNCGARIVKASKYKNSDLFWALLGGGGANFGVVTEIIYYVRQINNIILYEMSWPWERASDVLNLWQSTALQRNNQFNEDLSLFNSKGPKIHLTGIYALNDNETTTNAENKIQTELSSLKELDGELTIYKQTSYAKIYTQFVNERVYHNFSVGRTILTDNIVPADILINRIEIADKLNGFSYIGLQLMGGKISDVKPSETAFYPRYSKFFIDIFNFWDSAVYQEEQENWNITTFSLLYPKLGPYCYLGFPIPNLPDHLTAYYGNNKLRLLEIKKIIDPLDLLKFPGSL
jgi:hypothetical protein